MNESTVPWANSARAKPTQIPWSKKSQVQSPVAESRRMKPRVWANPCRSLRLVSSRSLRRLDRTSIPADLKALSNLLQGLMVFGHVEVLLPVARMVCPRRYTRFMPSTSHAPPSYRLNPLSLATPSLRSRKKAMTLWRQAGLYPCSVVDHSPLPRHHDARRWNTPRLTLPSKPLPT